MLFVGYLLACKLFIVDPQARGIFDQLCPDLEFLPTPPDPSDIVYEQAETEGTALDNLTMESSPRQHEGPHTHSTATEQLGATEQLDGP